MISQMDLKLLVSYDEYTGDFTYLTDSSRGSFKVGDKAVLIDADGYKSVYIKGIGLSSHRLAFLYMVGEIPEVVDHINGVSGDNRWVNLRAATISQNGLNAKCRSDNILGIKGLSFTPKYLKPFKAVVRPSDGPRIIERFYTLDEATIWLSEKRLQIHTDFARDQ